MVSTFFGFSISLRSLMTAQKGLEVTAHNIANANTPGYSRQRAIIMASNPIMYPGMNRPGVPMQLGTGVDVISIRRIRDEFLDHIIRNSTSDNGTFNTREAGFAQLEVIMNEPSETGLSDVLSDFFNSFNELANTPELASVRANVREKGVTLAEAFQQFDASLKELRRDQNRQIMMNVDEVNKDLAQIADLNFQIGTLEGIGDQANDLKDQRDLIIENMSKLINVDTREDETGAFNVYIGGITVVEKNNFFELKATVIPGSNTGDVEITFSNGVKPQILSGAIKGALEMRDEVIPLYQDKLNRFASALMNRVNYQHKLGYGLDGLNNRAFFNDYRTATLQGINNLPPGTTLDTTIDELGITAGSFFIQDSEIVISTDDARPGEAITLGALIERINQAQSFVRASLVDDFSGIHFVLDMYNPPDLNYTIKVHKGSSNFLDSVTGILRGKVVTCEGAGSYTNAMDMIDVSLSILDNLDYIAAAGDMESDQFNDEQGNNVNALAISELIDRGDIIEGSSFNDYYTSVIGTLGAEAQTNDRLVTNQAILINQLESQRQAISGVSIDEESLNMIQFQRAFEGAAKVSATLDSMIETIIFDLGVT